MTMAMSRALACCLAFALSIVTAPMGRADEVFSSRNDPAMEITPGASERAGHVSGLVGSAATRVRPHRGARLSRMLGADRARKLPLVSHDYGWVDAQPVARGDAQWACLTEALYFEARGESAEGVFAVAEVVLNRVDSTRYPDTVCAVINQGTGVLHRCQFSYNCDGIPEVVREPRAYERMGKIARVMLDGARRELTGGAQFYHTVAVHPYWAASFDRTVTIGRHHFYARG